MALLALLLPLFLLTGLGWVLATTRALASPWQAGLTELTAKIFIPAFLFSGALRNGIPATVSWQVLAAFFLPLLLLFLAAAYGPKRDAASAPRALAATYSNTVFVGIPVLVQAFGPASLQYAFPVIAFHGLIAFTLYYLAAPRAGGNARITAALRNVATNPIVLSLLLGLALNALQVALPAPLALILAWLAGAALPCALLALGASLAGFRLHQPLQTAATVAAKLVLLPAGVLAMATLVFRLPAPACAVLVLLAACPVGVNAAALVQSDGKNTTLVSSAILLSSALCVVTLPLWIWIVRAL
jgi:malonate transporter